MYFFRQIITTFFVFLLVKARRHLPYGIQYMAKILFQTLKARCTGVHEKDLLKVVGNLIYYRYINSAIGMTSMCNNKKIM